MSAVITGLPIVRCPEGKSRRGACLVLAESASPFAARSVASEASSSARGWADPSCSAGADPSGFGPSARRGSARPIAPRPGDARAAGGARP